MSEQTKDELPMIPVAYKTPEPIDQLTMNDNVYFQGFNEQPENYPTLSERRLVTTGEQPVDRKYKVGEEWTKLDFQWLSEVGVGMFIIRNEQGKFPHVHPTPEQRYQESQKILELGVGNTEATSIRIVVLPGESVRLTPQQGFNFFIKSLSGITKYTLIAFPR